MSNVVRFPGQPADNGAHCEGIIHHFQSVPGRCQCGERLWTELAENDVTFAHTFGPRTGGGTPSKETGRSDSP